MNHSSQWACTACTMQHIRKQHIRKLQAQPTSDWRLHQHCLDSDVEGCRLRITPITSHEHITRSAHLQYGANACAADATALNASP